MSNYPKIPFKLPVYTEQEMQERSRSFADYMHLRRSVREFSDRPVPLDIISECIRAAASAPSGANKQPWTFCVVSSATLKNQIREAAEKEEYESYHARMSAEWLEDLAPLETNWQKPFLEIAPYLIVVFRQAWELVNGEQRNNYYVQESVGLACGFLLAALHQAGLATLTHTPSPMNFLTSLLNRPENERPFLLIPVGYPADTAMVPDIRRKNLEQVMVHYK